MSPATGSARAIQARLRSQLENQDAAHAPARTQVGDRIVKLVERDPARDEFVEHKVTAQIVLDEDRNVPGNVRGAEVAAFYRLLVEKWTGVESEPRPAWQQADQHQLTPDVEAGPGLLDRVLTAEGLEGVIGAPG